MFPGSVESTPRSARSKLTNTTASNHTRHSIFRPDSPLSVSTIDAGDYATPQASARTARSGVSIADRLSSAAHTPREENPELMNNSLSLETPKSQNSWFDNDDIVYNSMDGKGLTSLNKSTVRASTSSQKDLNAANNMLPNQGESKKPAKLELRAMQNSYQNATYNVNKTPVNEVHQSNHLKSPVSKNQAEDYIKRVNMAASIIQHSFRRFVRQRKATRASQAAMKRLLAQKKEELERKKEEMEKSAQSSEQDRQRKREERAKQARQAAIEVGINFNVL